MGRYNRHRVRPRRFLFPVIILAILAGGLYAAAPYARAASLIVRGANLGGRAEAIAEAEARHVTKQPRHMVPTRYGDVPAQFYVPDGDIDRTVLLALRKLRVEGSSPFARFTKTPLRRAFSLDSLLPSRDWTGLRARRRASDPARRCGRAGSSREAMARRAYALNRQCVRRPRGESRAAENC